MLIVTSFGQNGLAGFLLNVSLSVWTYHERLNDKTPEAGMGSESGDGD